MHILEWFEKRRSTRVFVQVLVTFLAMSISISIMAQEEAREKTPPNVSGDELDLSVHDPMYFVVGGPDDVKARFQISFKYRILNAYNKNDDQAYGFQGFYFGYTQRALWNLEEESAPFEDSSYNPSFFADFTIPKNRLLPDYIRTGYEHESNGQGGDLSRSIDTYYAWLFWAGEWSDSNWVIAPKFWTYLNKGDENENIEHYRGNADLLLRYGKDDDWLMSTTIGIAGNGRHSVTIDLSYPLRSSFMERVGAYFYVQIFDGYGESLLTYDQKKETQFRIGIGFVR